VASPEAPPENAPSAPAQPGNLAAVRAFEAEARLVEAIGLLDSQRAILQRGAQQARAAKDPAEQERILREAMAFLQKSLTDEQKAKLAKLRQDVRDSGPFLPAGLTEQQKAIVRKANEAADKAPDRPTKDAILLRAFDQVEKSLSPEQKRRLRAARPRVKPGSVIGLDDKQKETMFAAQRRCRGVKDAAQRKLIMRAGWEAVKDTFTPEQKRRSLELLRNRVIDASPLRGIPLSKEQFDTLEKAFAQAFAAADRKQRGAVMAKAFDAVARTLPAELRRLYEERKRARIEESRRKKTAELPVH
jgi:hypothetical protein